MAVHSQTEDGSDFETFVRKGIADIRSLLGGFEEALEFQSSRTTVLEQKVQPLEDKIRNLETKMNSTEHRLQRAEAAENKQERFSRRNNFRIIGLPEQPQENAMKMVADFLRDFFGFTDPSIERVHRDGPKIRNLPRHLLVKMLSVPR